LCENLNLVRSIYAHWERVTTWADAEIEMARPDRLEGGVPTELASTAERWRWWLEAWDDYRAQAQAYWVLDDERALAPGGVTPAAPPRGPGRRWPAVDFS
jgi:hypothetical protein